MNRIDNKDIISIIIIIVVVVVVVVMPRLLNDFTSTYSVIYYAYVVYKQYHCCQSGSEC